MKAMGRIYNKDGKKAGDKSAMERTKSNLGSRGSSRSASAKPKIESVLARNITLTPSNRRS